MFKALIPLLFFLYSIGLYAQPKTIVIYKSSGNFDFEFLFEEAKKESRDSASPKYDSIKRKSDMKELMGLMEKASADTITARMEGNYIKTTSLHEGTKQRLYELPAKRFLVVEKGTRLDPERFDTTFSEVYDCHEDTGCNVLLIPEPQNGKKLILGFSCSNYTIKYKDSSDLYSIWVTDAIKPALPVHALVRSPKRILEGFTALEIKEYYGDGSSSHTLQKAIDVLH